MRRLALIVLSVSPACGPSAPSAPPAKLTPRSAAASLSVQPPAPARTAEPVVVPRRDRRGDCDLGQALDVFLTGQEAVRCGDLGRALTNEDYERARACVIAAQRARKPFTLVWGGPGIDSVRREAVAARVTDGRYEVRWFSYDSCPSGCGDRDPTWSSARCEPLVDLRAACSALGRKKAPEDEDLRWLCDEDGVRKTRRHLELYCKGPNEREMCGPTPP